MRSGLHAAVTDAERWQRSMRRNTLTLHQQSIWMRLLIDYGEDAAHKYLTSVVPQPKLDERL